MFYFSLSHGLRGAYCDGEGYILKANTRRELKEAIAYEANNYKDGGYIGANKKSIAWLAATAWRNRKGFNLPYALPLAPSHNKKNYCFGVFVSTASKDDFLEQEKNQF